MGDSSDSSASYIHMVQHLIEKCLILHMTKEECMEALSKHANIKPVITSTVWNELEKENKEFFKEYAESQSGNDRMSNEETSQLIQMTADSSKNSDDVDLAIENDLLRRDLVGVENDLAKHAKTN